MTRRSRALCHFQTPSYPLHWSSLGFTGVWVFPWYFSFKNPKYFLDGESDWYFFPRMTLHRAALWWGGKHLWFNTLFNENFQKILKILKKKKLTHHCVCKLASFAFQGFMQTLVCLITSNLRMYTKHFALIYDFHNIQQMPQEKSVNSAFSHLVSCLTTHPHNFDGKLTEPTFAQEKVTLKALKNPLTNLSWIASSWQHLR